MAEIGKALCNRPPCWSASWLLRVFPGCGSASDSTLSQVPIRQVAVYFWLAKQLDLIYPGLADPFISVTVRKFLIPPWLDLISNFMDKLSYENTRLRQWTDTMLMVVGISSPTNMQRHILRTEQIYSSIIEERQLIKRAVARAMAIGSPPEFIMAVCFAELERTVN